jgi:hypothetical protein
MERGALGHRQDVVVPEHGARRRDRRILLPIGGEDVLEADARDVVASWIDVRGVVVAVHRERGPDGEHLRHRQAERLVALEELVAHQVEWWELRGFGRVPADVLEDSVGLGPGDDSHGRSVRTIGVARD